MTKASDIMVCPVVPLRHLPESDRQVLRRLLFDNIKGLNDQHDKRWRRMWGRFFNAEPGEVQHLQELAERSLAFHARHMAIEQRLFNSQERYVNLNRFRDWLKTGAGWGEYKMVKDRMRFVPNSLAWEKCSDAEMREVHDDMIAFLHTPAAQRRLWPHLTPAKRAEMLDSILAKPEPQP